MEASNWKQLIIARKDLGMSPGKLAAQVSHGSMAFLTNEIKQEARLCEGDPDCWEATLVFDCGLYEGWIQGSFTKVVCEAKNRNQLLKAVRIAKELGLEEGRDYFLIKDNCLTELEPEEVDESGVGRTLTVVGFRPLDAGACAKISKGFQLYK